MNHGFVKTTLVFLFVIGIFLFFSLIRTTINTVLDTHEQSELRVTDPNKDTQ